MKNRLFDYRIDGLYLYGLSMLLFCLPMIAYTDENLPEVAMPDALVIPEPVADTLPSQPELPSPSYSAEPASPALPIPLSTSIPDPLEAKPFTANAVNIIAQHIWMDKTSSIDTQRLLPHSSAIQRVTIHHTATPQSKNARLSLRGMQRYHQNEKGWPDIAYHYLIAPDGKIYEGRNAIYIGSSSTDYALDNNLMIALIGNFEKSPPTESALLALRNLIVSRLIKYKLQPEAVYTHGEQADTLCPGSYLKDWYIDQGKAAISKQFFAFLPAP